MSERSSKHRAGVQVQYVERAKEVAFVLNLQGLVEIQQVENSLFFTICRRSLMALPSFQFYWSSLYYYLPFSPLLIFLHGVMLPLSVLTILPSFAVISWKCLVHTLGVGVSPFKKKKNSLWISDKDVYMNSKCIYRSFLKKFTDKRS